MAHDNVSYKIRKGITDRLLTGTTDFKTAITQTINGTGYQKLYFKLAPQVIPGTQTPITLPFVVMDLMPINQERDSATRLYRTTISFLVAALTQVEAEDVAGYLSDLLEDSDEHLSFSPFLPVSILRYPQITMGYNEPAWSIVVQYALMVQQ